jgi:hypothetical protein
LSEKESQELLEQVKFKVLLIPSINFLDKNKRGKD